MLATIFELHITLPLLNFSEKGLSSKVSHLQWIFWVSLDRQLNFSSKMKVSKCDFIGHQCTQNKDYEKRSLFPGVYHFELSKI